MSISAISERPWFGWASANNISAEAFDHAKSLAISLGFDPSVNIESGWYFANPESKYFGVGKIERDQVTEYAARKGMPLSEIERWLRPVLEYDA